MRSISSVRFCGGFVRAAFRHVFRQVVALLPVLSCAHRQPTPALRVLRAAGLSIPSLPAQLRPWRLPPHFPIVIIVKNYPHGQVLTLEMAVNPVRKSFYTSGIRLFSAQNVILGGGYRPRRCLLCGG